MKKILLLLLSICFSLSLWAQNSLSNCPLSEVYLTTYLPTKTEVNNLARQFSVDKVTFDERSGQYFVLMWLSQREYAAFEALNIPYELITPERPPWGSVEMANSVSEMANWDKYPTYSTYTQMLANFQSQFPTLCEIDTVLSDTPSHHTIFAVHISNNLADSNQRPAFWYSSTIHGDEPVGYYLMLHLIDYILNHPADPIVQNILQNVDLWITPLENPDGTYHSSDNSISSYYSTRANANGYDMNRNYPAPTVENSVTIQPETRAMINFATAHHFVMSANFHGGAELANFPWDTWESSTKSHADDNWFQTTCRRYVQHCQDAHSSYMTEEGGITEGGDWYVITGSRQDYMTYYQYCREITLEVSSNKVVNSSNLPTYWQYSQTALLQYILECTYGFHGTITDALTGDPLEAKIWINNHDRDHSEVYSHLPSGKYYRPIKSGTYNITVSADCYEPITFNISATDSTATIYDVQLWPLVTTPDIEDYTVLIGETLSVEAPDEQNLAWFSSETEEVPTYEGSVFTTPAINDTTTYWYQARRNIDGVSCRGERKYFTIFPYENTNIDTTVVDPPIIDTTVIDPPIIDTTITDTTVVDTTVGVDIHLSEINKIFSLFPNPTSQYCWIQQEDNAPIHIQVFDLFGRCVQEQKSNENKTKIDLLNYPAGIYIIRITCEDKKVISLKVIKQ